MNKQIKQIFYHYEKWEDFKNGMYKTIKDIDIENELINKAEKLLSSEYDFYIVAKKMVKEWKISAEVNLTILNSNRQAWIGQASCCYEYGTPENLTKIAWRRLSSESQNKANLIADKVVEEWEIYYLLNNDSNLLFDFIKEM
jgi:hypothetical protein